MGELGAIYDNLSLPLKEIGKSNLQGCYSPEDMVLAVFSDIDFDKVETE